jgi:hypothetical protein
VEPFAFLVWETAREEITVSAKYGNYHRRLMCGHYCCGLAQVLIPDCGKVLTLRVRRMMTTGFPSELFFPPDRFTWGVI